MVEQTRVHRSPVEFTVIPPESGGVHWHSTGVHQSTVEYSDIGGDGKVLTILGVDGSISPKKKTQPLRYVCF